MEIDKPTDNDYMMDNDHMVDESDELANLYSEKVNFTKSVFNITFENLLEQQCKEDVKDYQNHLRKEIQEWENIWRDAFKHAKKSKEKRVPIDISILSPENRVYLDKMPNIQKFINDSEQFRRDAHNYLESYQEVLEIQQNFIDVCEYFSDTDKEYIINSHLANSNIRKN